MHLLTRIAALVSLLAFAVTGFTTATGSATAASDVVGHLYVNDNTAGTNTIAAFDRHSDGTLTPLRGSPFAAGGAGTGKGIGSQGALQVTSNNQYLLAVDAGSNQISVLRVNSDGELSLVGGGPVSSDGTEPVSIAVHGSLVYVANAGNGGTNYTGFTLNPGGHLQPLAGSTVALPDGSLPGDVLFNGAGTSLVGTRIDTSLIDSFTVGQDGRLTAAPGSPFSAQRVGPFGSEFSPTDPTHLYVSNAHDGPGLGSISAYDVATDGSLNAIDGSPVADLQTAPCWVEITHDGQFLFTINTASNSISRYAIAADGSLTLKGSTPFKGSAGVGAEDARLGPNGGMLWVVDTGARAVSAFAVNGSNLTELPSSPTSLPAGSAPFGIVVI
ncbi:MAG TPA: beta-propeller fold lactonase family protein [Chloroflexota bacterium]